MTGLNLVTLKSARSGRHMAARPRDFRARRHAAVAAASEHRAMAWVRLGSGKVRGGEFDGRSRVPLLLLHGV